MYIYICIFRFVVVLFPGSLFINVGLCFNTFGMHGGSQLDRQIVKHCNTLHHSAPLCTTP